MRTGGLHIGSVQPARSHHDSPSRRSRRKVSAVPAAAQLRGPLLERNFDGPIVAAGHRLEQLGAHRRLGGEASRAAQDREDGTKEIDLL